MPLKILVCAYSCVGESGVKVVGGEAELGWNLVKQLSRVGQVHVLTHYHNQPAIEMMLKKEPSVRASFSYVKLPKVLSFLEPFHKGGIQLYAYLWQIKAYFIAKKLHRQISFDVFHHVTYANDWMASYIGALLPIPYVRGPGGGTHHVPSTFLKEFSLKDRVAQKIRSIGQWLFKHDPFFIMGQRRAVAILVCNKEAFEGLPLVWQQKAHFFPVNGISLPDFPATSFSEPHPGFKIISAGKLLPIKGFSLAIKAFKILSDVIPSAELTIIGDGPDLNRLQQLTTEFNLSKKVHFLGWLNRKQLIENVASSDVFLFPSLRDGGGAVVVEAMAAGKPVICLDMAGPGFHIDKSCGIKIAPHDPAAAIEDMAKALLTLYAHPEVRRTLGLNARQKAIHYYSWDILGDQLKKIYINANIR